MVVLIECGLITCHQDQLKSYTLCNWESGGPRNHISIIVINDETFFVLLPTFGETIPIFHHIHMLMTIDVHPLPLLLIPPVQFMKPLSSCLYMDPMCPSSQPFLDFWCCHIINDVLCMYVSFLCNFYEM